MTCKYTQCCHHQTKVAVINIGLITTIFSSQGRDTPELHCISLLSCWESKIEVVIQATVQCVIILLQLKDVLPVTNSVYISVLIEKKIAKLNTLTLIVIY